MRKSTPGAILMDAATHAALAGRLATESLGEVQLKGKSAPVPTFALASGR